MFSPRSLLKLNLCLGIALVASPLQAIAQQSKTSPRNRAAAPARAAASSSAPQYKAIWEPINYPDDIFIQDVYFVNDKVGWVAGGGRNTYRGGFIMKTTDGGEHWSLQVGDPHSDTPEVNRLQFLDATHGWAMQDGKLMKTSDGTTWQTIGPMAGPGDSGYQFTSLQDGFEIEGNYAGASIYATHDGGRTWKSVYQCQTTLQVDGLTRNSTCTLHDLRFVTPQVGYAVGGAVNDQGASIVKTSDGGASWKLIFASTNLQRGHSVFFTDENNGVVSLWDGSILITADGGQSWQGATGTAQNTIKFTDPEVGWSCSLGSGQSCSYTVDGGKNWLSRAFAFPSDLNGYSIPRRDRMFGVGDHGMIYRYRIVPASYSVQGMIDAPLMTPYGGALPKNLDQMKTQLTALEAKLSAAGSAGTQASSSAWRTMPSRATGPRLLLASYHPDEINADPAAGEPEPAQQGFVQDVSDGSNVAPSTFVQNCCATEVQNVQTSFTSVVQQVPTFNSQFRVLNLLSVAINMVSDLTNRAKQMSQAFTALKQAPNAQAALADIRNLLTQVQGTSQAIETQFQSLGAAPPGATGGGFIGNQAVPVNAAASASAPATPFDSQSASSAPPNSGTSQNNNSGNNNSQSNSTSTADQVKNQIKNQIKKHLPF